MDRLLSESGLQDERLSREWLASWLMRQPHEHPKSHSIRVGLTRQLAGFLRRHDVPVDVPVIATRALRCSPFVAHIYTPDEIDRLFAAADRLAPEWRTPLRHLVMPVLFRMLYSTGLRLGEALHLRVQDVDIVSGVLTVRQAKFRKDRLVPMSSSLRRCLEQYQAQMSPRGPDALLFPAPHGGAYDISSPYLVSRRLLRVAGIPHGGREHGPRVHDLRHTFAVRRFEAWYREGADLGSKLPVLASYLGHESLAGTQRYLQLTASLLPDLSLELEHRFGMLLPRRPGV